MSRNDPPRTRREPPAFRRAHVAGAGLRGTRLRLVTVAGPALVGFPVPQPAASVRLLLPRPGSPDVEIPAWNGNEFLLPDGTRPVLRTLTPRRVDSRAGELDVEIVLHGAGAVSEWASTVVPGAPVALSGPGRGYVVDPRAPRYLLAGDETAIPATSTLLEALAEGTPRIPVTVHLEVAHPDGRVALPAHPNASVTWHDLPPGAAPGDAMTEAVRRASPEANDRVWVAGEAAAVQRIRRHLFEERGIPRAHVTVRGYWKHGRAGAGA